ncbi:MAG: 50S ribosomal protein L9 [Patescibacteria group bacterium]
MKVVLLKDVKTLGLEGAVVEVSEGYARNFLFAQNLAVQASPQAIAAAKQKKERVSAKEKKELTSARKLAAKLDGFEVTVVAKMTDKGTLFGAVSPKDIAKALKAKGFDVEPEWITIQKSIKDTGSHRLTLDLPQGLETEIVVDVIGEK